MLCFARRSHRAAASLPLISLSGIRAPSALTGEAPYEDRFELPTTRRSFELPTTTQFRTPRCASHLHYWRSGLPAHLRTSFSVAHLRTRLKEAPSSLRATRDVMLCASHVAATALLHCTCLTHSVYTKCEKGWVFAKTKPQSIITRNGSALKLRNTCRHN